MTPAAFAEIDLAALQHNLQQIKALAPHSKVMAVIKANAYGHGLIRVAKALQGVDAFAVARVDEGIWLRKANIKERIAVLEGYTCKAELEHLISNMLEPVIHSDEQLEDLLFCQPPHDYPIWLKMDTGMNRLGFKGQALPRAYQYLHANLGKRLSIHLMTHLANADNRQDPKTEQQIQLFSDTIKQLKGPLSIANSAGILGWPAAISDWIRPGIMLYGVSPFAEQTGEQHGLQAVMSLHSRLIAVKQVAAGESVGYGGSWICEKDMRMGVVAIGYGDGYPRYARSGTPVLVNGTHAPLVGRVSMDMITVDISALPDAKPGDPITLWGPELPVETIAAYASTIPYTLLCGITQRVQIIEQ